MCVSKTCIDKDKHVFIHFYRHNETNGHCEHVCAFVIMAGANIYLLYLLVKWLVCWFLGPEKLLTVEHSMLKV